jgi:hypothetical protein
MKLIVLVVLIALTAGCANTHLTVRSTSRGDGGGIVGAVLHKTVVAATVPLAEAHSTSCSRRNAMERRQFTGSTQESSRNGNGSSFTFRQDCRD